MLTASVRIIYPGLSFLVLFGGPVEPRAAAPELAAWSPRSVLLGAARSSETAAAAPSSGSRTLGAVSSAQVASAPSARSIVPTVLSAATSASTSLPRVAPGHDASAEPVLAWTRIFPKPIHVGYIRASFGKSPTEGVPTVFRWEILPPSGPSKSSGTDGRVCSGGLESAWRPLVDAHQDQPHSIHFGAEPTQRSWHVEADACALRLVVDKTLGGRPIVGDVAVVEGARDVLQDGAVFDDRGLDKSAEGYAVDRGWIGDPHDKDGRWTATVRLPRASSIDRVRLELGLTSTSHPRSPLGGHDYGLAFAPHIYEVQVSRDGHHFVTVAHEHRDASGRVVPIRRRLLRVPRTEITALRIVVTAATDAGGRVVVPSTTSKGQPAFPIIHSIAAYSADDPHPVLAAPWVLSVNANPLASSHTSDGRGERDNDRFYAQFLRYRFYWLIPRLSRAAAGEPGHPASSTDFVRALSALGIQSPTADDYDGALESIEADDALLARDLLAESSPPPITVLSGSNNWDFATLSARRSRASSSRSPAGQSNPVLLWDPLLDASHGGMGRLTSAVRERVAPFLGFCGGAQILALLDARTPNTSHEVLMETLLKRNSGRSIVGAGGAEDLEYAWPWTNVPRRVVGFDAKDRLFRDLGTGGRQSSNAFLLKHHDALRWGAFDTNGPLSHLKIVAWGDFCSAEVVATPGDPLKRDASGAMCRTIVQAFRSRGSGYPLIGTQFHAEQFDFPEPSPGDVPWSSADARLLFAGAFEEIVDAHLREVAPSAEARNTLAVGKGASPERSIVRVSPPVVPPRS